MAGKQRIVFIDEEENKGESIGVFYSENPILCHGISIKNKNNVIEPFVGSGSLLEHFKITKPVEMYDLNPPKVSYTGKKIEIRDCLLNPPSYSGKTLITNPPYLASNKMSGELKSKYSKLLKTSDDLFKIFLRQIIDDPVEEGFIVLPFGFLFSIRKNDVDLRESFLQTYDVLHVNIFLNKVFEDTTTNVISIHFMLGENTDEKFKLPCSMIKSEGNQIIEKTEIELELDKENKYLLGGEVYNLNGKHKIGRYMGKNGKMYSYNIRAVCLDTRSELIRLVYDEKIIPGKQTDRMGCFIIGDIMLSVKQQRELIEKFNELLNEYRNKYCSLFLTNYRDGNRKRISFQLLFNMISRLIDDLQV